ncbi:pre-piRNA 3'-exonuclease trimmer-like [Aricia agestis]|uniref:pre-piRNA 3'-exonuclease trimmer-like n=1 Tax=Aricia agestis TaxID=91739 RepID=UPI001C207E09|nr:pre-piRNA 3'-exonuclease trimmer-like [Aricia agestis]
MNITNKNYNDEIDQIIYNLKQCSFVGFDAEFNGLLTGERFKHRLFDSCKDRYDNIKNEMSNMVITQVGLTLFQYNRDLENYTATVYTFHLCPQVVGEIDQSFTFHASSLQFLCRHNFNFNKFIYDGLPYLNREEEEYVRNQLKKKTLFNELYHSLDIDVEKILKQISSDISKWLIANEENTIYFDVGNPIMRYLAHLQIRERFPDLLTTDSLGNSHKILVYRDKTIEGAVGLPEETLEENLMKHLLGFSQIIELLSKLNKPIIGHNMFLDTILLHNQFIGKLPDSYDTFKNNINKLFPTIYDTKYISHEMSKKLSIDEVWKSNALQDLYEFFSQGRCKRLEKGVNFIQLTTAFDVKQSYHEAGWDSACSGYCFIRLAHWAGCELRGHYRPLAPSEKLAAVAQHRNRVNVIRGAVPYMNLMGADPPSHRPDLLHVKSMQERIINIGKVTAILANFGSIDVKPYGRRTALIAASTHNTVDKILKQFKDNREYKITKFSALKHSAVSRVALLSSALLTGSLFLYLLHKGVKQ